MQELLLIADGVISREVQLPELLDNVSALLVCGYYISLAIVRVGKLEKVLLGEWDRYVQYIKTYIQKCRNLKRIYIISAGKIIKEIAKKFTDYLVSNVSGIKLLSQVSYKARYYKGKPDVPRYIAIFEVE